MARTLLHEEHVRGPQTAKLRRFRTLRDPTVVFCGLVLTFATLGAVFADVIAPYEQGTPHITQRLLPPRWVGGRPGFLLGTDALGRDVLSELLFGARVSLFIAATAVLLAGIVGTTVGLISGYKRGRIDSGLMLVTDIQMAFPFILLAIAIVAVLGASVRNAVFALAMSAWPLFARIVRAEVLLVREREYVEAARVIGASEWRVVRYAILPNVVSPILIVATLVGARVVIVEASLSFLGLSVQPPATSWGLMIANAQDYLQVAWWPAVFPGLAICVTVLAVSLLGDWLRDRFDPRVRGTDVAG